MIQRTSFIFLLLISINSYSQTIIVPSGANWNYLDDGSNQGEAWYEPTFSDDSWNQNSPAELGYGDTQTTTVGYGPDPDNKYVTTYFRKSFNVADPSLYHFLEMKAIRDDGMVVYLNGVLVWSDNMPASFNYQTYASGIIAYNAETTWISNIISNTLVAGINVIAVEIHQSSGTSSDISFDFKLTAYKTPTENSHSQTDIVSEGANWNYLDDGSDQGTAWYDPAFINDSWKHAPAELGYGDTQTTTVGYGLEANNKFPTTYFRKSFNVADPSRYDFLEMEAIRDDGMVVYLNGVLVWSDNMPASFNYQTYASGIIAYNAETTWISNIISNTLVAGTNVLAVEIHQSSGASSDISFDFKLTGYTTLLPETPNSPNVMISSGTNWNYLDDGSNQGAAWYEPTFSDDSWNQNSPAELGYGDTQTTTVGYGPDPDNKYVTTYFRKSFSVGDTSLYNYLEMEAIRDDGMVVYLNGVLVWSNNIPDSFNYQTYATETIADNAETTWISNIISSSSLVTGNNVLAVEIHQSSGTSSDISFDFKLTAYETIPIKITREPYLQSGTPTSVIIKWRTSTNTESIINYGTSLGELNSTVQDNTPKTNHEITLSGLSPNTTYYYEIANLAEVFVPESSDMYVKTSPNVGEKQFVRAWILGDAGTANQNQRNVRDAYYNYVNTAPTNAYQTDMMLFLGDNAYNDGTDAEYQVALFDIYADMLKKSVAWSTLGNHDGHSATSNTQSGPYYDIFSFPKAGEAGGVASSTEAYYSFDYANIHFIVLESYQLYDDATQKAWCLSDIQSTTQDWIVAIFHHPAYTKGSHDSDIETQLVAMREIFLPILEENGVDLVLSGHSHSYERSFFINGHYDVAETFSSEQHTVGTNGNLSGKADTADGAYTKAEEETEGAVYITTGSAGKISGGSLDHKAMYASLNQLGSCVLEIENNGVDVQNLNVKFLTDNGAITDYFTIKKTTSTLSNLEKQSNSTDNSALKNTITVLPTQEKESTDKSFNVYPIPADKVINIQIPTNETLKNARIYNTIGTLVKESKTAKIDVSDLSYGNYMIEIVTDESKTYYRLIIK